MKRAAIVVAAFALGGAATLLFSLSAWQAAPVAIAARHPVWVEVKWPFLMDQWGEGAAFRCRAADCGIELNLYLRAKFGFCSSTIGVKDDEELERLSNFDFMDGSFVAVGRGHQIDVAWMKGRIRAYQAVQAGASALTAAFNNDSDAMVATILLPGGRAEAVEPAIVEFLNGEVVQRWVKNKLGL
jgi:hypothetical protein